LTATGKTWLATLSHEETLEHQAGFGAWRYGPNAVGSIDALMASEGLPQAAATA
jgi:hypothetical protein